MAVPAGVGAALEVVQAQAGLQLAVVVLDPPSDRGQPDEFFDGGVFGEVGQPVIGGFVCFGGPFGQQPALRQPAVGAARDVPVGGADAAPPDAVPARPARGLPGQDQTRPHDPSVTSTIEDR